MLEKTTPKKQLGKSPSLFQFIPETQDDEEDNLFGDSSHNEMDDESEESVSTEETQGPNKKNKIKAFELC